MKYILIFSIRTLLILLGLSLTGLSLSAQDHDNEIKNGTIIVKFKSGVIKEEKGLEISYKKGIAKSSIRRVDQLNEFYRAKTMKRVFPYSPKFESRHQKYGLHLWYEIEIDTAAIESLVRSEKSATLNALEAYKGLAEIELAEPIRNKKLIEPYSVVPAPLTKPEAAATSEGFFNDPLLPLQWHYNNTGQSGGSPGEDIRLFDAWEISTGSRDIIVSIHDEGIDASHPDLAENMWVNEMELNGEPNYDDDGNGYKDDIYGFNFADNTGSIPPEQHGTHVAGTISAVNNNGLGVSGIAGGSGNGDGVRMMSCRIVGGRSGSNTPNSFVYAADNGAHISQNSWGWIVPGSYEQVVLDAIDYFIAEAGNYPGSPMRGGVVICAAGNTNMEEKHYPAAYEPCVAVAALDAFSYKPSYSNYGDWVDISAPGGDLQDDAYVSDSTDYSNAVLSTFINDAYGYLDGTSMACPHVTGVAAIVASHYGGAGFTNDQLKSHILTGVREDIYDYAPNIPFIGKLGAGAIDGAFALDSDEGIPPDAVTDLELISIAQDEANFTWTVPADPDDEVPYRFELLYSQFEINDENLDLARSVIFRNKMALAEQVEFELNGLQATTEYYFAVRGIDRWGNISAFSNIISETTTEGPLAEIDTTTTLLKFEIDVASSLTDTNAVKLYNHGQGILRWDALPRHSSSQALSNDLKANLNYPLVLEENYSNEARLSATIFENSPAIDNIEDDNNEEMSYLDPASNNYWALGETDITFTNSSATRFYVSQENGFNLTHLDTKLYHDSASGPVIVEVYEGDDISSARLVLAQEFSNTENSWDHVELDKHLYFKKGSYFWTVFHVPSGNMFPLGAGLETNSEDSKNCYISLNLGKSWSMLEDAYHDNQIVWAVYAMSRYKSIGDYITLSPDSGEVASMDSVSIIGSVDGSEMINGRYLGSIVINTNEPGKPIISIPAELVIEGHLPVLSSPVRPDFGGVMIGTDKTIEVRVSNNGLGRFLYSSIEVSNPHFEYVSGHLSTFEAKTEQVLIFRYSPEDASGSYANVTLHESNGNDFMFQLFGVGYEPPNAELIPASDTFNLSTGYALDIGDTIHGDFILKNSGSYPLDYYMPAYSDGANMEDIPDNIHKFGYIALVDTLGVKPEFKWEDISISGTEISGNMHGNYQDNIYYQTEMGFEFPFFGKKETSVYISRYGVLTFDTEGPIWARTPLIYDSKYNPMRHISAWGMKMDFASAGFGKVYYKRFMDRFIVQYDSIPWEDGWAEDYYASFQIVLHDNGNINFYYEDIHVPPLIRPWGTTDFLANFTYIGIQDRLQDDGILIHDQQHHNFPFTNGSVIEFINPGLGLLYDVSTTYGTLDPGDSTVINYSVNTDSLYVQEYNEILPVVTNDPYHNPLLFLVNFEIIGGGTSEIELNADTLDLGSVFQYDSVSLDLTFTNTGKASDSIISASFDMGFFKIHGNIPEILKPKRSLFYPVSIVSDNTGTFTDTLRIAFKSGKQFTVFLTGTIIEGPEISTDPISITATAGSGKSHTETITVSNTGDFELTMAPIMKDWIWVKESLTEAYDTLDIDYIWESSLDEGGPSYQWTELADTGTKVTGLDAYEVQWSEGIPMPFTFNFYGIDYDTLYIGYSGLVTFTPDQGGDYAFGGAPIPYPGHPDNYIAPLWVGGGTDYPESYPKTGQYYSMDDEKIIIEWRDYINGFSMGNPISFQVILYRNNKIKFQYDTYDPLDLNFTPEYSVIGVENHNGKEGVEISYFTGLISQDMSLALYPVRQYKVPAGGSKEFEVTLDASELYAEVYEDSLTLSNNDPVNKNLKIPVTFTVTGKAEIVVPDSIHYGDLFVIESDESPDFYQYQEEYTIENTGTKFLSINKFTQSLAQEVFTEAYVYVLNPLGYWDWGWYPVIQQNPWDQDITPVIVEPETSLKLRTTITPDTAADLNDNLIIATSIGTRIVPIVAEAFLPPLMSMDVDSVIVFTQDNNHVEMKSILIGNRDGGYPLHYELGIEYNRQETEDNMQEMGSLSNQVTADGGPDLMHMELTNSFPDNSYKKSTSEEFNRILSHDSDTIPFTNIGYGGGMNFHTATRFIAPSDGFNLTAVQTWYRPGSWLNSEISVKIYGGSPDIYQSELIHEEIFAYDIEEKDDVGKLLTFKLSESILFYPDETFFIEFGYDPSVEYPQGLVKCPTAETGQFLFGTGDLWYDLEEAASDFAKTGWMVRAVEEEFASSVWVTLDSPANNTIDVGGTGKVILNFDALFANKGKNYAQLHILSNDPDRPDESVTLLLWVNDGPHIDLEETSFSVLENEIVHIMATATDMEGNDFSMSVDSSNSFTTWDYVDGVLTISCAPQYDDQGIYNLVIVATDEYDNSNKAIITVEVLNVNRAPEPIDISDIHLKTNLGYYRLTESEMFVDPDGDALSIVAVSDNDSVITVFASGSDILLEPGVIGEALINLTATDIYDASAVNAFNSTVSEPNSVGIEQAAKLQVFPNPVVDKCIVQTSDISGDVVFEILDAGSRVLKIYKRTLFEGDPVELKLSDLPAGSYMLRMQHNGQFHTRILIKI